MLKISCAGCLGLSLDISSQLTLEMCAAAKNCKKFTQNSSFKGSRSLKVINVDKTKESVNSACYDEQHVQSF